MTSAAQRLRHLLQHRFGWRLEHDRGDLDRVLIERRRTTESEHEYLERLALLPSEDTEFRAIAESLAVSETYFFRNPEQFAVLADVALPAVSQRGNAIRILSLGAASGEEAYSVAMTILQFRKRHQLPPVEILGIDVSRRAVERARGGRYSPWALRALPAALTKEFFVKEGRHYRIHPEVAAMARFEEGNLLQLATIAPGPWDIVFFRNTFMYFTPDAARRVFGQLSGIMPVQSYLFLGHAETLRDVSTAFALRHSHQTFYYQRDADTHGSLVIPPMPAAGAALPAPPALLNDDPEDTAWFHEIARATARIASLVDDRVPPASALVAPPRAARPPLAPVLSLLREERYGEALTALGPGNEADQLLLRAVLFLNVGQLANAVTAAEAVLAADDLRAGAHYVLALCAERAHDTVRAVRHDEMAIHLDDTFAMPHLHLALLARRRGDHASSREHARRARTLLPGEDDLRIVIFAGGFSRQALLRLCDAQVDSRAS